MLRWYHKSLQDYIFQRFSDSLGVELNNILRKSESEEEFISEISEKFSHNLEEIKELMYLNPHKTDNKCLYCFLAKDTRYHSPSVRCPNRPCQTCSAVLGYSHYHDTMDMCPHYVCSSCYEFGLQTDHSENVMCPISTIINTNAKKSNVPVNKKNVCRWYECDYCKFFGKAIFHSSVAVCPSKPLCCPECDKHGIIAQHEIDECCFH